LGGVVHKFAVGQKYTIDDVEVYVGAVGSIEVGVLEITKVDKKSAYVTFTMATPGRVVTDGMYPSELGEYLRL